MQTDKLCACGRTLTPNEQTYFGTHCASCEIAMSDALNEDKDPKILELVEYKIDAGTVGIVGFTSFHIGKEFVFTFLDGSKREATLVGSNVHGSYDEDGKPRNLLINLDFK